MEPNDPPSTLGLLLARHNVGDQAAVNDIILHCQERFQSLARIMLRRFPNVPSDIETGDVINELYIRLMHALHEKSFEGTAQFLSYSSQCVRNYLIDLAKKGRPILVGGANSDSSSPNLFDALSDNSNEPTRLAEWGEFHAYIGKLPDEDRILWDLLFYQGLTKAEVSNLLCIPPTTLRTRWLLSQANLKRILGDDTPF
jgi:RNA polymerase sigma factor (sigma-70 family)